MPSVTKSFVSSYRGVSVSPDGSSVSSQVAWTDSAAAAASPAPGAPAMPPHPEAFTSVRIANGKIQVGNTVVGDAPADIAQLGRDLAAKTSALLDSLISSGKIKP
jgi:hypothetical protein